MAEHGIGAITSIDFELVDWTLQSALPRSVSPHPPRTICPPRFPEVKIFVSAAMLTVKRGSRETTMTVSIHM